MGNGRKANGRCVGVQVEGTGDCKPVEGSKILYQGRDLKKDIALSLQETKSSW